MLHLKKPFHFKGKSNPSSTRLNPAQDPNTVVFVTWWSPFQKQTEIMVTVFYSVSSGFAAAAAR